MHNGIEILHLTNAHRDFYRLIGPFLAKREIVKELGSPVWDDDGKVWTIALDCKGKVSGFVAHVEKTKSIQFCSDFVLPDMRRNGIYSMLMRERMKVMSAIPSRYRITAVATAMSIHEYLKHEFREVGRRGRFRLVERENRHLEVKPCTP